MAKVTAKTPQPNKNAGPMVDKHCQLPIANFASKVNCLSFLLPINHDPTI